MRIKKTKLINMTWHRLCFEWNTCIESDWNMRVSYIYTKQKKLWWIDLYIPKKACNDSIIPKIKDTIYIVSDVVCWSLPDRDDLYVVYKTIKNSAWKIVAATGIKPNPYFTWN